MTVLWRIIFSASHHQPPSGSTGVCADVSRQTSSSLGGIKPALPMSPRNSCRFYQPLARNLNLLFDSAEFMLMCESRTCDQFWVRFNIEQRETKRIRVWVCGASCQWVWSSLPKHWNKGSSYPAASPTWQTSLHRFDQDRPRFIFDLCRWNKKSTI